MFETADWMRIQLDLIKGVPVAYQSLLTRLQKEGLNEMEGGVDGPRLSRLRGILDECCDRFVMRA
ncbi:hypothetical protein SIID45300_01529 [Candidatus Magnetaquicoccaceae bacterium FCR-1]|uniref:Uncharacterized protein n=1 Tax=Candidatus Magnetaquiglobus chichijimensis TaxID=3141448 RepID=A0ABQ0C8J7_9PROT